MPQATSSAEGAVVDDAGFHEDYEYGYAKLMSTSILFHIPGGLGIYWIASAVVRSVQQWFINRHLDKMDINDLVK